MSFLQYLNSRHNNIEFTIEFEHHNEIPFFDILVKRGPNTIFMISVYPEKRHSQVFQYTKWDSFTPRKYKIHIIKLNPHSELSLLPNLLLFFFATICPGWSIKENFFRMVTLKE